jgi:predicted phosphodiesterase
MITVISDVHGKYDRYYKIIRQADRYPYTVQLGDFGFKYDTLKNVDPNHHKIIAGNHDNYNKIVDIPHYLGDFGYTTLNDVEFFYYRGAYSIDRQYRTIGIDWWSNEENNIEAFQAARELYREKKPKIVITHDCPEFMVPHYIGMTGRIYQNMTGWALGEFYNNHQPDLWIHGHYHLSKTTQYGNTKFVCLDELEIYNVQ